MYGVTISTCDFSVFTIAKVIHNDEYNDPKQVPGKKTKIVILFIIR